MNVRGNTCRHYFYFVSYEYAGPGGGVESKEGRIEIEDSAITDNACARGGGVAVGGGTATIVRSLLKGNAGIPSGGGLEVLAGAVVTVDSSAVVNNVAYDPPPCAVGFCPSSLGHGFGIDNFGTVHLANSTVADND